MTGTPDFVAPEVLQLTDVGGDDDADDDDDGEEDYTVAVDLWSLGCVVFQLLTSEVPFTNRKKLGAYCRSKIDRSPIGLVSRFASAAAIEMIKQLLEPLPSNRTTAEAALDNTWLREASELPVGYSTPLAPSAEVARRSKHNTDFQVEGRNNAAFVTPRTPSQAPEGYSEKSNEFVSTIRSEISRGENASVSSKLLRHNEVSDHSMDEGVTRILNRDSQQESSFLRRVSNSVRSENAMKEQRVLQPERIAIVKDKIEQ